MIYLLLIYFISHFSYHVYILTFTNKIFSLLFVEEPFKASKPTVTEYNTTSFNVEFPPSPSTNGRIITYELQINQTNNCGSLSSHNLNVSCVHQVGCRSTASQKCNHVLYDLLQCATYSIRVRAYTSKGPGPFSDTALLKTSGKDLKSYHD